MQEVQADAVALWIAHTHAIEAAETTPYLAVTSALKRSGKTRLREVLELLVREPLSASNMTEATLFRAVEQMMPTLLLDEADAIFEARNREELRGMLNAGYRKGAVALRMGGANYTTVDRYRVYCPKAFFGIGEFLPDTLQDRVIRLRLERRLRGLREESIERFRVREAEPEGHALRDGLAEWLDEEQIKRLRVVRPELPEELDDRAQDSWEPLFAIADLAGGNWPQRAKDAALALSTGEEREDDSISAQLLRDLRAIFEEHGSRFMTADLLAHLCEVEESPWNDWYGKPLSAHGLSKLLKPYRIKTMTVKVDGEVVRGYKIEQFADAFARVLGVTSVTSDLPSQAEGNASNASNAMDGGQEPESACDHPVLWLARDGKRRCLTCDPPAFAAEVVEESPA
jgi:hypothetical protein